MPLESRVLGDGPHKAPGSLLAFGVALAPPGRPLLSSDHHYFLKVPKKPEGAAKFTTQGNEMKWKEKEGGTNARRVKRSFETYNRSKFGHKNLHWNSGACESIVWVVGSCLLRSRAMMGKSRKGIHTCVCEQCGWFRHVVGTLFWMCCFQDSIVCLKENKNVDNKSCGLHLKSSWLNYVTIYTFHYVQMSCYDLDLIWYLVVGWVWHGCV